jgi:hypothetical protein
LLFIGEGATPIADMVVIGVSTTLIGLVMLASAFCAA